MQSFGNIIDFFIKPISPRCPVAAVFCNVCLFPCLPHLGLAQVFMSAGQGNLVRKTRSKFPFYPVFSNMPDFHHVFAISEAKISFIFKRLLHYTSTKFKNKPSKYFDTAITQYVVFIEHSEVIDAVYILNFVLFTVIFLQSHRCLAQTEKYILKSSSLCIRSIVLH